MRLKTMGMIVAAGAFAVAVPAAAHTTPAHPAHPSNSKSGTSHKCATHEAAYIAHGTVMTWSATQTGTNGTWDGSVTINVKKTNHFAKGATTFTLTNTKVRFGHGASNPPVSGDRVVLVGKIAVAPKKCTTTTGTAPGTTTTRKVDVRGPKHS